MAKYIGILPKAYAISTWGGTEILYKCKGCGAQFNYLKDKEKFCHNCGEKQNWNVQRNLDEPMDTDDLFEQTRIIASINKENRNANQKSYKEEAK